MLPHALFAEAARRGVGLCLNVRHDNPARRLSERAGFRLVPGSGVRLGQFIAPNSRSRESGNPGQPARSAALDPRFPGGDDKADVILSQAVKSGGLLQPGRASRPVFLLL
jgi:hypothetical protein